ncbi:MAG: hypothetical protein D084_Lepto4C00665G0003 [Leptospirillum sp. Group IV 'UBA BS']|nr:MAG: hypothetical protein D084_Lepto4C00665G0003 [Leptospirillum sp. Group IV 'UBA BS']
MVRQHVLPFKLESTNDTMTSQAGLVLFGEFLHSLDLKREIDRAFGIPGSGAGYPASAYVLPLLLMLNGGGRSLSDLRMIARDKGLLSLLGIEAIPSTDAFGRWLRRMGGKGPGLSALERVIDRVVTVLGKRLRRRRRKAGGAPVREVTLDIDASQIVAEKKKAHWTYKGEKGYMPLVGHVRELSGMVVHEEFRDGNVSPGTGHVPFLKDCLRRLPDGVRVTRFRADSASYQAEVFNLCFEKGIRFVVGADLDAAVRAAIGMIPDTAWRPYRDGHIAETVHTMNKTHNAFRLIVVRKRVQGSLPGLPTEPPSFETRYKVLATNHKEIPEWVLDWYNQRGDDSENRIKELKIGFGMERMPSGETKANALFFRIGVLAYNLFLLFRGQILSDAFDRAQIQTVRWQVYQVAGKVVRHAGALLLKVADDLLPFFQALRERSYRLMCQQRVT